MKYGSYKRKMSKAAEFLKTVFTHIKLIAVCAGIFAAALTTMIIVTGTVKNEQNIPDSISYGDPVLYSAEGILSSLRIEYGTPSSDGETIWSETQPIMPGAYSVRTVTKGLFGTKRYRKTHEFTIVPREINVGAEADCLLWGKEPVITAGTVYNDKLVSYSVRWDSLTEEQTGIGVVPGSVVILNQNGEDVTSAYQIGTPVRQTRILTVPMTVTVSNAVFTYDGKPVSFDGYEITEGGTVDGDRLTAVFDTTLTLVGEVENKPELRVVRETGEDVTLHYSINIIPGKLTVEKRPLTVETESAERVYDGYPVTYRGLSAADGTSLAEGQYIEGDFLTLTNVGIIENLPNLRVIAEDGTDVSDNYALFIKPGTLKINPRPVKITTESAVFIYDACSHFIPETVVEGLAEGHTWQECPVVELTEVGQASNARTTTILDASGQDVTSNYEITTEFGTVEILPRPCTVITPDGEWIYDGIIHDAPNVMAENLVVGHTMQFGDARNIQNVGRVENERGTVILDEEGRDVTGNYEINCTFGMLTITPRQLNVSTGSETWVYDGEKHSLSETVIHGLIACHTAKIEGEPYITNVGTSENKRTITVFDENGQDVTGNYELITSYGTLEITPRPVTIKTDSGTWVYDGSTHFVAGEIVSGLVSSHKMMNTSPAPILQNVGEAINSRSIHILDGSGNDVTGNYSITTDFGTIRVTPRPLNIVMGSESWIYDGKSHQTGNYTLTQGTKLAPKQRMVFEELPSLLHVGTITNAPTFKILNLNNENVTSNYDVVFVPGTLTCRKRPIGLATGSETRIYDGSTFTVRDIQVYSGFGFAGTDEIRCEYESFCYAGVYINALKDGWYIYNTSIGEDVTNDYEITMKPGTVTVQKRPVTIGSVSESKVYDGRILSAPGCMILSDLSWGIGDVLDIGEFPHLLDIGKVSNKPDVFRICKNRGTPNEVDVTDNYTLTFKWGTLEITPRPVVLKVADTEKIYDGLPLITMVTVLEDKGYSIAEGETLHARCLDQITNAGTKNGRVDPAVTITRADGTDSTGNYRFTFVTGKLTVLRRPITVVSGTTEKRYDGYPLKYPVCEIGEDSEYQLVSGHTLTAVITGSQTKVGSSANTISAATVKIMDEAKVNVTANYEIKSVKAGILTVLPAIKVTVKTGSASKAYDCTPLTCDEYDIEVEGENWSTYEILVKTTGTITEPGIALNSADVTVINNVGRDVTNEVEIDIQAGQLIVLKGTTPDQEMMSAKYGEVTATAKGTLYLREVSYVTFTGNRWVDIAPYGKTLPGGISYNMLTSVAMRNAGGYPVETAVFEQMSEFMVPTYFEQAKDGYLPDNDAVYNDTLFNYSVAYYNAFDQTKWLTLKGKLGEYASLEEEYRKFVHDTYMSVDPVTKQWLIDNVIEPQGFDASDPNIINLVADYVRNAAEYNIPIADEVDRCENTVIAFLSVYKAGVCRHYASTTTLILRILGFPARYVVGFAVPVEKDKKTDINSPGHAWCEVYIDSLGWVIVESTGGDGAPGGASGGSGSDGESGGGSGQGDTIGSDDDNEKITIIIEPQFKSKVYDGTPLYADNVLKYDEQLQTLLNEGYTYSVQITGEQTLVGDGYSMITEFHLFDPSGKDVTSSPQFKILQGEGVLRVLRGDIRIFPYQISKYYDGESLTFEQEDFEILNMPAGMEMIILPIEGTKDSCLITLSDMNANIESYIQWKILLNGEDVSDQFTPIFDVPSWLDAYSYIPYEIKKRSIELMSGSVTKVYDGKELMSPDVWISKGSLSEGDKLYAKAAGRILEVGTAINLIPDNMITIIDRNGYDVTDNYIIDVPWPGWLTVLPSNSNE